MGRHTLLSRREESASAPLQSQQTVVSDYVVLGWESGKQRQGSKLQGHSQLMDKIQASLILRRPGL